MGGVASQVGPAAQAIQANQPAQAVGQTIGQVAPTQTASQQMYQPSAAPQTMSPQVAQQYFAQQRMQQAPQQMGMQGLMNSMMARYQQPRVAPTPANPITNLYQSILGRAPDEQGAQYWQSQMNKGMSINDIQNAFLNSNEYKAKPITNLYQSILGRAPDEQGAQYWQTQMNNGMPINEIQNAFLNSQEYKAKQAQNPTQQAVLPFMPQYGRQAQYNPLAYRPNMTAAQQALTRVKPSVYKTDLDAARAKLAEYEAADKARQEASQQSYNYGG